MTEPRALTTTEIPVESAQLFQPSLEEIAKLLNEKLTRHFQTVSVQVVDCPDLTKKPFSLACKGLNGSATVVEIGGVPYLLPKVQREKLYDLRDIPEIIGLDAGFITGAGAGPWPFAKVNCEMVVNMAVDKKQVKNFTRIGTVNKITGKCVQEILPDSESRTALLSNIFVSKGESGKVLKVHCKIRTGKHDFVTALRTALAEYYGTKPVGIGGVFVINDGRVKQHVMPDFSETGLNSEDELNDWLRFYDMSTPLIAVGTLVSHDPGLDLRVQHFHSFSHHGEAGHYHIDTTPETIEYIGYFNTAEKVYRLDKPKVTHQMGRD